MADGALFNIAALAPEADPPGAPPAHTNTSTPTRPVQSGWSSFTDRTTKRPWKTPAVPDRPPPLPETRPLHSSHAPYRAQAAPDATEGMLSTPLVDYKHAANQTTKARAAAEAAKAKKRASSSTSGNSGDRKNGSGLKAKGEQPGRSSSLSSTTNSSALTGGTQESQSDKSITNPFEKRHDRLYLRDATLPYPLPVDLAEIHRQTLRTMLLCQVFNGPICSPDFDRKPPKRVLEVACGSGFWSVMCHRHFARRGFTSISFTGIDIVPLAPRMDASNDDMNWRFVQHDLRRLPLPFRDDEFNLVMVKDLSMVTPVTNSQQRVFDEYLRILKPGGTLEIWDEDHCLRMLLPHAPPSVEDSDNDGEDEEQALTNAMGTYTLSAQTPLAAAHNQYIQDYNNWMSKALESRKLTPIPCTQIRPLLLQESDTLIDVGGRRLAVPLGEVRWEREGVGGASLQGTKGVVSSKAKANGKDKEPRRRVLTAGQAALRRTALMTFVQMIEHLAPVLREVNGHGHDEWDRWQESMMTDLLKNNGTSWGECLEVCAGWARKKKLPRKAGE